MCISMQREKWWKVKNTKPNLSRPLKIVSWGKVFWLLTRCICTLTCVCYITKKSFYTQKALKPMKPLQSSVWIASSLGILCGFEINFLWTFAHMCTHGWSTCKIHIRNWMFHKPNRSIKPAFISSQNAYYLKLFIYLFCVQQVFGF